GSSIKAHLLSLGRNARRSVLRLFASSPRLAVAAAGIIFILAIIGIVLVLPCDLPMVDPSHEERVIRLAPATFYDSYLHPKARSPLASSQMPLSFVFGERYKEYVATRIDADRLYGEGKYDEARAAYNDALSTVKELEPKIRKLAQYMSAQ